MENQLVEINKTLNELKSSQNKLISSVNEQGKMLKHFNTQFEDVLEQMNKITTENPQLKNRITLFEDNFKTTNKFNANSELNIMNDIFVRQFCAKNIIVYNLPEVASNSSNTDPNNKNSVDNLIKVILNQLMLTDRTEKQHNFMSSLRKKLKNCRN